MQIEKFIKISSFMGKVGASPVWEKKDKVVTCQNCRFSKCSVKKKRSVKGPSLGKIGGPAI